MQKSGEKGAGDSGQKICYSCGKSLEFKEKVLSRSATCEYCSSDLHCCRNCGFYDPSVYNECHEINAERVLDKEKRNFCEYFEWGSAPFEVKTDEKQKALEALKNLFKS